MPDRLAALPVELSPLAGKETQDIIGPPDSLWQCGQLQVLRG
ncbi:MULTISPECIES: hypothetical protein [Streptomyces]|nr:MULTISPECIES: hypothetical protein [unclassified Streptomyces]